MGCVRIYHEHGRATYSSPHKLTIGVMEKIPHNPHPPDGLTPASIVVASVLIVGIVLGQASPKHGKDVSGLASQSQPREERLEGGIGAGGDGGEGGRENKYGESGMVRCICALGDIPDPGVPREGLAVAVR